MLLKRPADPAVAATALALWLALALFVIFPMTMLFARVFWGDGGFTLEGVRAVLSKPNHVRAFWNSLLLAAVVGFAGTVLGFLFA